jgi:dipeptidyl aminopeptidase/acylaminoacyl peptidase
LMDISQNAGKVAEILKAKGTIYKYHIVPGIPHYGVYRQKFKEVTEMELAWFDKHLKTAK